MSADSSPAPRVLGNLRGLRSDAPEIVAWTPPTPEAAAARPPLPAPAPRPAPLTPPAESAPGKEPRPAQAERPTPPPPSRPPRPAWIQDDTVQALVWERPEDTARVLRFLGEEEGEMPKMQRIAIVCVALGHEPFGEVMKFCSDHEIEAITKAVASLQSVSSQMQKEALEDLGQRVRAGQWVEQGGMDYARGALERAVGPRKAREFLDRVAATVSTGFQLLKDARPEDIAPFISYEHPQTIALILSQLEASLGAGVLDQLPSRLQVDVSYRIATMREVTPAAMKELDASIEAQLRGIVGGAHDVGGPKVLADILNLSTATTEKTVLDAFDETDDEVSESVRNLMFVFDDLRHLSSADLKTVLDGLETDHLAIALKAVREPAKEAIRACVGEERWQQLAERMEWLGPMRLGEVEQVQLRIVAQVRQLEEHGKVTIVRGPDDNPLV